MKRKFAIILMIACMCSTFVFTRPIDVSAKTKIGKVKNFTFDYTSSDDVRLKWSKYKKADGYQIYKDGSKIQTIKAKKSKKTYAYLDKKFDFDNNDRYLVKAYKVVKSKCKKVKKIIAKSQTIYVHKESYGSGVQNGYNIQLIEYEDTLSIKGYYNDVPVFDKREPIKLKINTGALYKTKKVAFYGREITGVNESGYTLGPWTKLLDDCSGRGNIELNIPGKYIAFGFEFDIFWGTEYPYSNVFMDYTGHDFLTNPHPNQVKNINIETGGSPRIAWIEIVADNKKVVDEQNCESHKPYPFD